MAETSARNRYIAQQLGKAGIVADPRHVEAWMRLEHPILGSLSNGEFNRAMLAAAKMVHSAGLDESEALAQSIGL